MFFFFGGLGFILIFFSNLVFNVARVFNGI